MKITAFHGSGTRIDQFDYRFTEIGNDQLGSGFYFTSSIDEAIGYCTSRLGGEPKPGGMLEPHIHVVELTLEHPMKHDHQIAFTKADIMKILLASPDLDDCLMNWGDVDFEGRDRVLNDAADTYVSRLGEVDAIKEFNKLSNDFFSGHPRAFFEVIREIYGFDGVMCDHGQRTHYVAWFPEQIEVKEHINLVDRLIEEAGPMDEDPEIKEGMMLFHGTSLSSAEDIVHNGIDFSKTTPGYFGNGFYCATDINLAVSNYAEMADDDETPAVVAMKLLPHHRILDMRKEADWEFYKRHQLDKLLGTDRYEAKMRELKVAGLYDRSFGGLVIYDADAVSIVGLANIERYSKKMKRSM